MTHAQTTHPQLPPAGPAWAGSLMGTSIAATLTSIHGVPMLPVVFALMAAGICAYITIGWLRFRKPAFHFLTMGPWGMYSMGILAMGSAWNAVTGDVRFQIVTWWIGTALAIIVCLNQLRGFEGKPAFAWGLALVSPMVGATGGGQLAEHGAVYWWVGAFCFVLSLITGLPLFARVYWGLMHGNVSLPGAVAGTAWIPLGIVGQSTAAAHVLFGPTSGVWHAAVMFTLGVPMALFALFKFCSAVFSWAHYSPGWWGSTFPTGTISLGAHYLALGHGWAWAEFVSQVFLALLLVHWTVCVVRWAGWLTVHRRELRTPLLHDDLPDRAVSVHR